MSTLVSLERSYREIQHTQHPSWRLTGTWSSSRKVGSYSVKSQKSPPRLILPNIEYPSIRVFTLLPGVVASDMSAGKGFDLFAKDEAEQTGALALYLASSRGDYLKGSLTSINWDLEEMEAHKEDIAKGLLKTKWVPILPTSGGAGW
jgi:hypothetical protein